MNTPKQQTTRTVFQLHWRGWLEGLVVVSVILFLETGLDLHLYLYDNWDNQLIIALLAGALTVAIREAVILRKAHRERDRALDAFKGSKELYRHIVENAHEMIFEVDIHGRVTFANKAAERFMEYPASELLGKQYRDFVLDSHKDSVHRFFALQAARNISSQYMEGPAVSKSGKVIWFGQHTHLKREGEKLVGFQVISRDVTERRAAEQILRKREKTIRTMFDQAPIGMSLVDRTGRFIETNQVFADMLGYTKEELRKKHFPDITHNEDVLKTAAGFYDLLGGRKQTYQLEKRYIRKDGKEFWGRLTISKLDNTKLDSAFAIGMVENIDDWKLAEASNRRLLSIVEETTDLVATANPSGRLLYLNKAGRVLLGIGEAEHIAGISPSEFYNEDMVRELKAAVRSTVEKNGRWQGNTILKSRSGREIPVSQVILGHTNEDGNLTYFSTIARDITKEEEVKAALDRERTLLRTILEAIPDEVAVKDTERRFILANSACVRALKRKSAEEVLGLRDEDIISPVFAMEAKEQEEEVLRTGKMVINSYGKNKIDPVTGTILRGILMTKVPLRNNEGIVSNIVVINRDVTKLRRAEAEKERVIDELKIALAEVRTLSGLLPICASCKKIRDDGGYWNKIESFIETHTSAQFSHGLCPDCMGDYFPGAAVRPPNSADKERSVKKETDQ